MDSLQEATDDAERIIRNSLEEHEPVSVHLLNSGGHDSLVSTHVSHRILEKLGIPSQVVLIDTTIGVPENEKYVEHCADRFGWNLRIIRNHEHRGKSYDQWVRDEGTFPLPDDHKFTYAHLKREAVRQIVREEKTEWKDRVLFLTGVYADESERRAGFHQEEKRDGAQVWTNPCFNWSGGLMAEYRRVHSLPVNELAAELGKSVECLCGAYASPGDLEAIRAICPALAERLERLADEISPSDDHRMRWDMDEIPDQWRQEAKGQKDAFREPPAETGPLCHDCTR